MAFTGLSSGAGTVPNPDGVTLVNGALPNNAGQKNSATYNTAALTGNAGDPDITAVAGDTGVFTTANPAGTSFHGLPTNFGRGRGAWVAADITYFEFSVDPMAFVQDSGCAFPYYCGYVFANGNFYFYFHNKGDGTAGAGPNVPTLVNPGTRIRITYNHSVVR